MQDCIRVDLIFPRSGQILAVYVPDVMLEWVARRNLEIFMSLWEKDAPRVHIDSDYSKHMYPS